MMSRFILDLHVALDNIANIDADSLIVFAGDMRHKQSSGTVAIRLDSLDADQRVLHLSGGDPCDSYER